MTHKMVSSPTMQEKVFLNDSIIPAAEARIPVQDAGLLHGVGLFETMRSYRGRIFRMDDHLDRMFNSAAALGITISQQRTDIVAGAYSLLKANALQDARLRITVTAGNTSGATGDESRVSTLVITAAHLQPYSNDLYRYGMTVTISPYKQNPHDPTAGHKTVNYLSRLLALQQAHHAGAGEAIWFTPTNCLAEGSISNIFLVSGEGILTPSLETGILPGISRKLVAQLAGDAGISCQQKTLHIKDLLSADEVFLTNSIMEIMPVCKIEKHIVGNGKCGPIYNKLHDLYRRAVDDECAPADNARQTAKHHPHSYEET